MVNTSEKLGTPACIQRQGEALGGEKVAAPSRPPRRMRGRGAGAAPAPHFFIYRPNNSRRGGGFNPPLSATLHVGLCDLKELFPTTTTTTPVRGCGVCRGTKPRKVGGPGDAPSPEEQPHAPAPKMTFLTRVLMWCPPRQSCGWARNRAWGGGGERITARLEIRGGRE